jgi:diguanylate cyclase (GGDEF)-like protein
LFEGLISVQDKNCQPIAEKLRCRVQKHRIQYQGREPLNVSASFGVSCSDPTQKQTFDAIFKAADEALYRAKAQGRNRVVL